MKKNIFMLLLCANLAVNYAFSQTTDSYLATIQKITTIMQNISQKVITESINTPTRSSALNTDYYYKKMIEGLEEEVGAIIADKNYEDLSQEEKDIIQMLETYTEQLKLCCPDLE